MQVRIILSCILVVYLSLVHGQAAEAAKKKKPKKPANSGTIVQPSDVFDISVTVKVGKKNKTQSITCLEKIPGTAKQTPRGLLFTSFTKQITKLQESGRSGTKLPLLRALNTAGKKQCNEPEFLSLKQYTGAWTEKEVRRLLEVFALGGREEDVGRYVQMGMEKTVADLLTIKPDAYADGFIPSLSCDPNPDDETQDCYDKGNINDWYLDGYIDAYNLKLIFTNNPVRGALWLFAMDERAPGNPRVLNGDNLWMYKNYMEMVDRFATTGDAKQFVIDYASNGFAHGKWLSGVTNHYGFGNAGNQDFGREIMELVSIGTRDWNNQPTYTDLDVEVASRACSGLAEKTEADSQGNRVSVIGYFPDLHYPGMKTIFPGTPFQSSIDSCDDLARVLVSARKKQYAYELARRLWPRFISSLGTTGSILKLADRIEANDFKLWPVIGEMMRSRAFYSPRSAETITKDPQTFFVTYARMMGIPIERYHSISDYLGDIGMEAGRPPTVFGFSYNKKLLVSDLFQLERFNSLFYYTMWQNFDSIEQKYGGWTFFNAVVNRIPRITGDPGSDAVGSMLRRLNLSNDYTEEQKAQMVQFINYTMGDCYDSQHRDCFLYNNRWRKLYRDAIDLGDAENDFYRLRLLAVMLGASRNFQTM